MFPKLSEWEKYFKDIEQKKNTKFLEKKLKNWVRFSFLTENTVTYNISKVHY